MSKKKPGPPRKRLVFTWDDEGGAHIQHDDDLRIADLQQAFASLLYIVVHNLYLDGGPVRVADWLRPIPQRVKEYLLDVERGETHGTRIAALSGGVIDSLSEDEVAP